jgi:Ecdysteroid kinase-like family
MPSEAVDTSWLSEVLGARVASLELTTTDAFNSSTLRVRVRYDDPAVRLPQALVLKRNSEAAWAVAAGREEADFYAFVGTLDPRPPGIVPCLASGFDEDTGNSFVLMPDLSATHAPPVTRARQIALDGVPEPHDLSACVTTLARHHAYWWDHPSLGTGRFDTGHWSRDRERLELYRQRRSSAWSRVDRSALPAPTIALYDEALAGLERHWQRTLAPRFDPPHALTLGHGDTYFANFLCPTTRTGTTYLIDWQGPEVDHCGNDLANLFAAFWTTEQRHQNGREQECLRLYHRTLVGSGVEGYSWEDLVLDYRSGLLYWLLVPIQDAADGSDPAYWLPKMRCLESAVRDWDCLDLVR